MDVPSLIFPVGRVICRHDPGTPGGNTAVVVTPLVPPVTSDISTPVSGIQRRLEVLDPTDADYLRLLPKFLNHQDLRTHVQGLQEPGLKGFVDLLDKVTHSDE